MSERKNISVGPAGVWGSAFAKVVAERGHRVKILLKDPQEVKEFNKTHNTKKSEAVMPRHVKATSDLDEFAYNADLIAIATHTQGFRSFFRQLRPVIPPEAYVASLSKGLERETRFRMTEIILQEDPALRYRVAAISGPSVAAHVAKGAITGLAIATHDLIDAKKIRSWLASNRLTLFASDDPVGVEYGGAFKNVMALGAGIADAMGASASSKAFYLTRALEEMIRLGTALGGKDVTFRGVSGLGDLHLSCSSNSTRNFRAGKKLAEGWSVEKIQSQELAEGLYALDSVVELALNHDLSRDDLPIVFGLSDVVHKRISIEEGIRQLIGLQSATEHLGNQGLRMRLTKLAMRAWHNFEFNPLFSR